MKPSWQKFAAQLRVLAYGDTVYGLSSAVFTQDLEKGVRFARGIKAGMTHLTDSTVNDEPHVMFGGEQNSGPGRFNGDWAVVEFTTDHWIGVQTTKNTTRSRDSF